jgi:BMFP domain-containing protein YqiC
MMAVIIFIALASLSDGSRFQAARMLPISHVFRPVIKVQFPCQPSTRPISRRCGAKDGSVEMPRPKLGQPIQARDKTGQSVVKQTGEPPVEIPRVEELLRSLMQGLPPGLASGASGLREDIENNFRAVLRANLGKLDLAGREEFDTQRKVLERTRARLEELEKRVAELERVNTSGR